jgi:hypothetical protein
MKRYLVSYDLVAPGRDYSGLISALETAGASRVLLSQWIIRSSLSAVELRDRLRVHLDSNDRILVNEFTNDWASYNVMIDINRAA